MHLIQQGIGVLRRFAWISVGCMVVAVLAAMAAHVWFAHCLAVWLLAQVAWLVGPYVFWRRHWADWPWEKRLLAVAVTAAAGMCLAAQVVSSLGWLTLEVLGAVWCGVGALAVLIDWVVPRPPSPTVAPQDDPPPAWHARLYLTVVLAMVGYYAFRAFVLAVEPVSDAPMYHLYFAARWLKAGRLDIVPIPFGESAAGYFPSNAELIYVWWMLPFHADTLAKLGQLPFALLGAVAVFGLARELGASRTAGTYAAASYLAVGPICAHSALANVDLAMACFELAAVYFLVVCCRRFTRSDWALAGLACGVIVVLCAWSLWDVRCLWLGRIGAVVALPFVFAAAVVALVLLVVLILGRGLMASAVSFEGSDSFDAVTRAGDYVLRRPWRLGFYWLAATLYGIPCTLFVAGLVVGAMFLAVSLLWMGIGNSFADTYAGFLAIGQGAGLSESVPSFLLGAVVVILGGLVAGWCVSFVQCYRAISYALLRQSVDHSRPSEVFLESGAAPPRSPGPSRPQQ